MAKSKSVSKKSAAKKKATKSRKAKAPPRSMPSPAVADLDGRIAIIRDNLRSLVEQAASYSGASDEERMSQRIAEQEAKLERLKKQRDELVRAL